MEPSLQVEFQTFRDLVDTIIEEKDKEIARLLEENAAFQPPAVLQPKVYFRALKIFDRKVVPDGSCPVAFVLCLSLPIASVSSDIPCPLF
jgi:hypothetical protein